MDRTFSCLFLCRFYITQLPFLTLKKLLISFSSLILIIVIALLEYVCLLLIQMKMCTSDDIINSTSLKRCSPAFILSKNQYRYFNIKIFGLYKNNSNNNNKSLNIQTKNWKCSVDLHILILISSENMYK